MPPIRAPKVLQQAWDKKKTVRQNYAALGLIHDLNPSESGGAEIVELDKHTMSGSAPESSIDLTDPSTSTNASGSAAATTSEKPILSKGQGRIVRDEAGNVLRVELHEEEVEAESPAVDGDVDMEQLEPQLEGNIRQTWVSDLGGLKTRLSTSKDTALQTLSTLAPASELERRSTLSASLSGVGPRHTSERELAYLQRLMDKYKGDVEAMARDRKLNSSQRTAGELIRALKRAGLV
ncbi:hypothetical protein BT96DRAFT_875403 [Gymnopus androsaceus JB14]|uniref:Nucleolar protein 16 n=1 Tax=Gymnopus androsaceus JB14 TaxID=1447944 RepID=A0A6A4I4E6_9AGAR|nr:hypothetical protein BT96DRAFT_875403 [Gymnopus androsaceus JB14]